jgi:hypothetical protein
MGALSVFIGLVVGLAGPGMLVTVFWGAYLKERRRITAGGDANYQKTLLPSHPEARELAELSARAKELGMGE